MGKKRRKLSGKRYEQSYKSRDGGGSNNGVLDFSKLEDKVNFFKPNSGVNKINIIPYEIKSKSHPLVKAKKAEIGELDYLLDIHVHYNSGPNKVSVLCLNKTYGKACPICEERSRLYNDDDKDGSKLLTPKRRVFYNVQPIVKGEVQDLKVWEVSHYLFEKELIEEARGCENGEDIIPFADIEDGKVIKFRSSETSLNKNVYDEYKSFDFKEREEELDEDLIDEAISFDELLKVLTYEEVEHIFYNGDDEDEDEEDDEDEDVEEDVEEDDEEVVEKKQKKDKKKKKQKKVETVEEDDEEDDEVVEKKQKKDKKKKKTKCPNGHTFGKDFDEHDECEDCDLADECIEF